MLNGIGGKIEKDESSFEAMRREFLEEAGVDNETWKFVGRMFGIEWNVDIYTAFGYPHLCKTMESERVGVYVVDDIKNLRVVSNIKWIIPLIQDKEVGWFQIKY